ncbi:MAG: hypothetical protein IH627_18060 [Rubrivivax sp.]|nr:hypothetical protein [Rubrivivax sp.]
MKPEQAPKSEVDHGRRRLATLGVSGTAVVLSVTSRSAVAGWGTCTGSELASGNLSRAGSANPCGCSPGFWWNNNGEALWASSPTLYTNFPRTAAFNTVFGRVFYKPKDGGGAVLLQDVGPSTSNENYFGANNNTGMHAVAALLNAQYFGARYPTPYQTAEAVKSAFQSAFDTASLATENGPRKAPFISFVATVDIYDKTSNLWCNGDRE